MAEKKHIAIVCQRFGKEINGGAEVHARQIALQLQARYNVTILTSCAIDHATWQPEFSAGTYEAEGLRIIRFANHTRASRSALRNIRHKITGRSWMQRLHRLMGKPRWWSTIFPGVVVTETDHWKWLALQGPYMPDLADHLRQQNYAAVLAITMLYYPAAITAVTIPSKTILIPTLHDEKASYYPVYQQVMAAPAWILFNTTAEQELAQQIFNRHQSTAIAGVGVALTRNNIAPDSSILTKYGITGKYMLYVGRIDKNKGCGVLLDWFKRYLQQNKKDLRLVMVGKSQMQIPSHPSVIVTGFVPDADKQQLMLQAQALVMPSFFESLSLVLLESMACAVPVVANAKAAVLKDHILKSEGGWLYENYEDFAAALDTITGDETIRRQKGESGYQYIEQNYSWQRILQVYIDAIEDVAQHEHTY